MTGVAQNAVVPTLDSGWKAVPIKSAMLIGPEDAVDQAAKRIAADGPMMGLAGSAEPRQAHADLWAVGSAGAAGPDAASIGMTRFAVKASLKGGLASDLSFEFSKEPNDEALQVGNPGQGERDSGMIPNGVPG